MGKAHHLGKLQYAIMRVLWEVEEATVSQVLEALPKEHRRAPTTIATMLTKMERKGVVAHRNSGRLFVYRPRVSESAVARSMVGELCERLFDGDPVALVSHLIEAQEIDAEELDRLRTLVDQRRDAGHGS